MKIRIFILIITIFASVYTLSSVISTEDNTKDNIVEASEPCPNAGCGNLISIYTCYEGWILHPAGPGTCSAPQKRWVNGSWVLYHCTNGNQMGAVNGGVTLCSLYEPAPLTPACSYTCGP